MTTFLKSPHNISLNPCTPCSYLNSLLFRICGRRFVALSIGPATNWGKNETKDISNYLISKSFGIGAYKGVKVSYRKWNRQLRQPVLLAAPRSMVSVSPQEGYLHPNSELDTLGTDDSESSCKF